MTKGLTREIVAEISERKKEPAWMTKWRQECRDIYEYTPLPTWGPDLRDLDLDEIITYVQPLNLVTDNWEQVPDKVREDFRQLGIPQAEENFLAGVGAQVDSEMVYHRVQEMVAAQGVVYLDLESAMQSEYEQMIHDCFMTLIKPTDHKFVALHGAIWSGGSFVYVPKNVSVTLPLQAYFRLNAKGAGQFEHTLIIVDEGASLHFIEGCSAPRYNRASLHAGAVELFVRKGAKLRYTTIENWSRNMYNLNTKRAIIDEGAVMEWISGSFGSARTCLYPETILAGRQAKMTFEGVTLAGAGQILDTGVKVQHKASETTSAIHTRSLSKGGGSAIFRSSVWIDKYAKNVKTSNNCESLLLDDKSRSDAIPAIVSENERADIGHEARVGKISSEQIEYLRARGLSEQEAVKMIVGGFVKEFSDELPLEYALEMINLVNLELSRKGENDK